MSCPKCGRPVYATGLTNINDKVSCKACGSVNHAADAIKALDEWLYDPKMNTYKRKETPANEKTIQELAEERAKEISQKREEILGAFIAQHGCLPDECVLEVSKNGSTRVRKATAEEIAQRRDRRALAEGKPPLGALPRWLHEEHRIRYLLQSCQRYAQNSTAIPQEWLNELSELNMNKEARRG